MIAGALQRDDSPSWFDWDGIVIAELGILIAFSVMLVVVVGGSVIERVRERRTVPEEDS